jgi:hypothetical protein
MFKKHGIITGHHGSSIGMTVSTQTAGNRIVYSRVT